MIRAPRLVRIESPVTGLACGGGGALVVERVLRRVPGVAAAYVNPANDTAYVDMDPSRCDPEDVRRRLAAAGYLPDEAV